MQAQEDLLAEVHQRRKRKHDKKEKEMASEQCTSEEMRQEQQDAGEGEGEGERGQKKESLVFSFNTCHMGLLLMVSCVRLKVKM